MTEWRTSFPAPLGFDGDECGDYGDPEYERALTPDEHAVMADRDEAEEADRFEAELAAHDARDRWFAHQAAANAAATADAAADATRYANAPYGSGDPADAAAAHAAHPADSAPAPTDADGPPAVARDPAEAPAEPLRAPLPCAITPQRAVAADRPGEPAACARRLPPGAAFDLHRHVDPFGTGAQAGGG